MIAAPLEVSQGEGSKIDRQWMLGSLKLSRCSKLPN